jgi:serine/threonine protein kinase
MAANVGIDRQAFLENLTRSGLATPAERAALEGRLPVTENGRAIARSLIEQGFLTRFQAERLLAGRVHGFVLGQYRILDQLGKGGMGRVFKAVHRTMNRIVALKVLSPQLVETERAQKLFLREMQAVARLTHPNLVTAYDANQLDDRYYLVMEYVDGPSMHQLVRERGPLPIGLACELVRQTAVGLQYAADMGMVHRDIKPSNLLVQFPGGEAKRKHYTVRILDFGLARLQEPKDRPGTDSTAGTILTQPDSIMGTPDFLSPEQARDLHSVDIRSDLYSLGCTMFYLLAGIVPFPGGAMLEKLVRHATREPTPVEQLRPEAPPAVAAAVKRLMAKDPAERFQTPAELAVALEPYASEEASNWPSAKPAVPVAEVSATPVQCETTPSGQSDASDEFDVLPGGTDEQAAYISTVPPDMMATPVTSYVDRPILAVARTPHDTHRLRIALGIATGIVLGGLTILALIFGLR